MFSSVKPLSSLQMIMEFVLWSTVTRVVSPAFRVSKLNEACSLF